MANVARGGFRPLRHRSGGDITFIKRMVLTANATAIFRGDAVIAQAGGDFIVTASTNTLISSVAQGASYLDAQGKRVERDYLPAATAYTGTTLENPNASFVYVVDQPADVDFMAQVDEGIALTDLNLNYVMVLTAGSTVTGLSGHVLDATGRAVTATFPWRVRDFWWGNFNGTWNDPTLANCKVIATINAGQTEPDISAYTGT